MPCMPEGHDVTPLALVNVPVEATLFTHVLQLELPIPEVARHVMLLNWVQSLNI